MRRAKLQTAFVLHVNLPHAFFDARGDFEANSVGRNSSIHSIGRNSSIRKVCRWRRWHVGIG